jgi:hypothetical protein
MGVLVEFARRALLDQAANVAAPETTGPILAVKICGSLIGDYWVSLSDTEPFDPGDGLPVYRPAEIRALAGKGYGPDALLAVHRLKVALNGQVVR